MHLKRSTLAMTLATMIVLLLLATACTVPASPGVQTVSPVAAMQKPGVTSLPATPPTIAPTRTLPAVRPAAAEGDYLINQRATSTRSTFERINLVLYRATLTREHLILRVGFHNISEASFIVTGTADASALRLVDTAGNEYTPVELSDTLKRISPQDGFRPGQANVGDVAFPVPSGPAPYELRFPTYDPIVFALDEPAPLAVQMVPEGTYPLAIELYSNRSALAPIRLRLDAITVTQEEVILQIAFVNTLRQGYNLGKALTGRDSRLFDAEFAVHEPITVSDSLAENIAPAKGWLPGQAHAGQVTFARPERMEELRFMFPEYAAATLRFDTSGLTDATVTSLVGGVPPPTATPTPEQVALRELEGLLEQQAKAVVANDLTAYMETFIADLRLEQQMIFIRSRALPLTSYQLSISPETTLLRSSLEDGRVRDIAVFIRYHLRGTPEDNPFQHTVRYTFERRNGRWLVSEYRLEDLPPFWWTGGITVQETPHFVLLARPDAGETLAKVAQECEQAYSDLQAAGLEPETRLVAYYTTSQEDFTAQVGRGSRTLGAALSLYEIAGEHIQTLGRAFYINGQVFREQSDDNDVSGRLATIRHELVHLALARETRPFTPIWLVEGAAMYYAEQLPPDLRRRLVEEGGIASLNLERLTGAETLGAYDLLGQHVGYEYIFSGEVVRYLIETYGIDRFRDFYRYYSRIPAEQVIDRMPLFSIGMGSTFGNISRELTPDALSSVYGLTIAELDAAVKLRLREQTP